MRATTFHVSANWRASEMKRFLVRLHLDDAPRLMSAQASFKTNGCEVFWRGFVANPAEIEQQARRRGCVPEQRSEAVCFALASDWWGAEMPRHITGEYAAAIYDNARRTLLLVHDELGLVPLFYAETQDGIVAGSHLDDVVDETGVGELDEEYIADYLVEGWHLGARTPYAHIRRLLPGESMVWQDGRLTRHQTWTLNAIERLRYRDHREYEEHLRQLLAEAVKSSIPPCAKVLCELSGGLDSSTVLALAVRSGAQRIEAFSFIYPESYTADERAWINAMLEKYPVRWNSINADAVRPFTEMPDGSCIEPNLSLLTSARHSSYYQLLAANNIDVVLTGVGGDATLLGDGPEPYYLADLLRGLQWRRLWEEVRSWSQASEQKRPPLYWMQRYAIKPLWHPIKLGEDDGATRIHWLSEHYLKRMGSMPRGEADWMPHFTSAGDSWFFQRVFLGAYSVSMRYQDARLPCPFRHPLLYRPLVAYMCSVPWEIKLHPQCDRLLQRRAFEDLLPTRIIRRRSKLGPDQAFYSGLEASSEWVERLTVNPRIVQRGYVDAGKWSQTVQQARLGRTTGIRYFLASASLEIWLQQLEHPSECVSEL